MENGLQLQLLKDALQLESQKLESEGREVPNIRRLHENLEELENLHEALDSEEVDLGEKQFGRHSDHTGDAGDRQVSRKPLIQPPSLKDGLAAGIWERPKTERTVTENSKVSEMPSENLSAPLSSLASLGLLLDAPSTVQPVSGHAVPPPPPSAPPQLPYGAPYGAYGYPLKPAGR